MEMTSGTVNFLFTDIEGSTVLLARLGNEGYAKLLAEHHQLVREALSVHGGTEVDTQGDAFFALIASAGGAAAAAIAIQRSMAGASWPDGEHVQVRMGLHCGDMVLTSTGPVGFDVHRAARVAGVAHGGQIVVSETAAALLRDALPDGASLADLGQHRLKDLGRPEHIFQLSAEGLEANFPPLRSLDNPELEHNLPIQLTSFIGRERALDEIRNLVDESRLVTVVGPGGAGKSRVALQVAADLVDGSGDGVWLVDLSVLDVEEQVVREVASVLGVREESGRPLLEALVESLQYRDLFVVLDNCEHVIDATAKLAETLVHQCPKIWVLATSREPLAVVGERVYRLPPLGLPPSSDADVDLEALATSEAVRLFVARAREHRPEFALDATSAPTIASVCRHLDGIPLALELAAARVRSMSLEEVERHLGQRFRLLSSRSRTSAARQQTLEGAVAWSYDLLNDSEKLVFATLSVFPATFDLPAAESVCAKAADLDEFEVVDLIESLVDKSLLQTEQGESGLRYRMLETIAHYATDRLADYDDHAALWAQEAHALYYLTFVEEAAPYLTGFDQLEWRATVDADFDNIRTALSTLVASPDHGIEALRLVGALWVFGWVGGETLGGTHVLARAALEHPRAQSRTKERSGALLTIGWLHEFLGEVDPARATYEAGALIAKEIGESHLAAVHLSGLAFQLYRLGDFRRAKEAAEEALAIADGLGDPNIQAMAHERMAISLMEDPKAARAHFVEALHLFERAGNRVRMCNTYNNLGNLEMTVGDFAAARTACEAALVHVGSSGEIEAVLVTNLGFVNLLEGHPEVGRSQFRDALRQYVRLGSFGWVQYALLGIAVSWGAADELERSAVLHGAADAMIESQGFPWESVEAGVREKAIATLRQRMEVSAFEDAYSRGRGMPDLVAIALALSADASNFDDPGEPST